MPLANLMDVDTLAARIPDGAKLAVPADYSGVAMAVTRALVRQGRRNLHLVCLPTSGIQADLLIGARAVSTIETSAISLGEYGPAPRFSAAVKEGRVRLLDATCPAIHAGLQAAQKGIPFMPLRGIIGSDLVRHRADWQVAQNPFSAAADPILLVAAIRPDVALFHAPLADRFGNVWIGRRRELVTLAQAAQRTLVSVEKVQDRDLFADERMAAGVVPALYIEAVAETRNGAWPLSLWDSYPEDESHLRLYAERAATADGFADYLARHVQGQAAAQ